MKHPLTILASVLLSVAVFAGCATIFTGTSDVVTFESEPSGARVMIDGIDQGRTPTTVPVNRPGFSDRQVTIEMEGYEPRTFVLQKSFNTISILNLGSIVGWAVDAATGAIYRYRPQHYTTELRPQASSHHLDELERDDAGRLHLPKVLESSVFQPGRIVVYDPEQAVQIVFEK